MHGLRHMEGGGGVRAREDSVEGQLSHEGDGSRGVKLAVMESGEVCLGLLGCELDDWYLESYLEIVFSSSLQESDMEDRILSEDAPNQLQDLGTLTGIEGLEFIADRAQSSLKSPAESDGRFGDSTLTKCMIFLFHVFSISAPEDGLEAAKDNDKASKRDSSRFNALVTPLYKHPNGHVTVIFLGIPDIKNRIMELQARPSKSDSMPLSFLEPLVLSFLEVSQEDNYGYVIILTLAENVTSGTSRDQAVSSKPYTYDIKKIQQIYPAVISNGAIHYKLSDNSAPARPPLKTRDMPEVPLEHKSNL
ncbi:hypothetical protein QBC36DRAFT_306026 [Triangularia setosa]|uniref:Uncharacterized protein n=1 Tax=Triangularia setosa TaxID=2587417 RepID=A0AAN6WI77_9PEZI|nr:hypothetical protein QBC36DRAFT_306026 [Podospora setosa]